jgi:dihydropteroate synthase
MLPDLPSKRPLVMGILNITPDSFSGDGLMGQEDYIDAALKQATLMKADGADIFDIGGESSRPGAFSVSANEEIRRVVPVIEALRKKLGIVSIAVDTVKAEVARAALEAGANIVNDISALAFDSGMAKLIALQDAYVVLMHNRSQASSVTQDAKIGGEYQASGSCDIVEDVAKELLARARFAEDAGIAKDRIILDPGLGFGKTPGQNLSLIRHVDKLKKLGYPVLIGSSRKSFIGRVLDLPVEERLEGTAATVAIAALLGADIIRVHDVKFMARTAKMAAAIGSN